MNKTQKILAKARELYEANPSHAPFGDPIEEPNVCVIMAIDRAAKKVVRQPGGPRVEDGMDTATTALRRAIVGLGFPGGIVDWNAKVTTAEVLVGFDLAIEGSA